MLAPNIFLQGKRTAARFEIILEPENRAAYLFALMFAPHPDYTLDYYTLSNLDMLMTIYGNDVTYKYHPKIRKQRIGN